MNSSLSWKCTAVLATMLTCLAALGATPKKSDKDASAAAAARASSASMTASTQAAGNGPEVAHIRLAGAVLEVEPEFSFLGTSTAMTLRDWLQRFAQARTDDRVKAVALEIDSPAMTWAQGQELADAVARLNAVKPVYAYMRSAGSAELLVAGSAREITMAPTETLLIPGLGAEMLFFRGTLDKLGIEPQFIQIGKYKGASEPVCQTQPSKELASQYDALLDDLYAQLVEALVKDRKMEPAAAKAAIDDALIEASDAQHRGLVDRLSDKAGWHARVVELASATQSCQWVEDYAKKSAASLDMNPFTLLTTLLKGPSGPEIRDPTIAVVNASGMIISGSSGDGFFGEPMVGARTIESCMAELTADARVKAVILRIDSPGGSAEASERMYQAIHRCAEKKPVIVSVSSMAASGGYYIASAGRTIIADEAAIVGSIGVVTGKLAMTGLMDKIGVTRAEFLRGKNAGLGMLRPWTPEEEGIVRKGAERTYDLFISRVAEGRKAAFAKLGVKIEDVAQGRIFTARKAVEQGLVDKIGGFREAVAEAEQAANIKDAHIITMPKPRNLLDMLTGGAGDDAAANTRMAGLAAGSGLDRAALELAGPSQRAAIAYLFDLASLLHRENILTAMPCAMVIHR